MKFINRLKLREMLKEAGEVLLLDVRSREKFREEHIPGARFMAADNIGNAFPSCIQRDKPIVTYCDDSNCMESFEAAGTLDTMGYKNVYRFVSGLRGWKELGLGTSGR